jgi:hypothetical protein
MSFIILITFILSINFTPCIKGNNNIYCNNSTIIINDYKLKLKENNKESNLYKNLNFNNKDQLHKEIIDNFRTYFKLKKDFSNKPKIIPNILAAWDLFGHSISLSGDTAIISAIGDNFMTGSAYIFNRIGNQWLKAAKIRNAFFSPNEWFGLSVSIDGDMAIVSAPFKRNDTGEAYIFEKDGAGWKKTAILLPEDVKEGCIFGGFTAGVSISNDYAIVGAPGGFDENGIETGVAYMYQCIGGKWVQTQKLTASDGEYGQGFGLAVSIDKNYAIISKIGYINESGSAYFFKLNGGVWEEVQKINVSEPDVEDYFGFCVSMKGNYAIVSKLASVNKTGAAYVFKRTEDCWVNDGKLIHDDVEISDEFGWSIDIDEDHAIIGSHNDDDNGDGAGSAYIFKNNGSGWEFYEKLITSIGINHSWFGYSVSIDGEYALIGAPEGTLESPESVYVFKHYDSGWKQEKKITTQKPRPKEKCFSNNLLNWSVNEKRRLTYIILRNLIELIPKF